MAEFIRDLGAGPWGNYASLLGLIVSVAGFGLSLWQLARTRRAADAAAGAARDAATAMSHMDAISECAQACRIFDEIERLQREGAWRIVPDRYSALRDSLISVRELPSRLDSSKKEEIRLVIAQCRNAKDKVETDLAANRVPDAAKLNRLLSVQAEKISEMPVLIRRST